MSGASPMLRILVVEDEAIIAMMLEDMLAELGHDVVATAASLAEGIDRAAAGGFDLALLDLNLGGVHSTPIADRLAEARVPFAFTTGYGASEITAGFPAVPLVAKPYTLNAIAAAIDAALAR